MRAQTRWPTGYARCYQASRIIRRQEHTFESKARRFIQPALNLAHRAQLTGKAYLSNRHSTRIDGNVTRT